ncbi:hypothetical protein VNO78_03698 [Psophocarpus tetragonolobus]|uniref:Uncharacterized protein n=1 Tax=Psophocarpus tetragonolobus TaxID=3891 RepID=A0AAN9XWY0_PSOTE
MSMTFVSFSTLSGFSKHSAERERERENVNVSCEYQLRSSCVSNGEINTFSLHPFLTLKLESSISCQVSPLMLS